MATLSDLDGSGSIGVQLSGLAGNAADAQDDAGINTQRALRNYEQRQLPALQSRQASRGTFFSGHTGVQADQLRQDVGDTTGDYQRLLTRQMSDFARQRLLATLGVVV